MCEVPQAMNAAIDPEPFVEERWVECVHCRKPVHVNHQAFWFHHGQMVVCLACEHAEMAVWRLAPLGENGGYYDSSPETLIDILKTMEDGESFSIHRGTMKVLDFVQLPEFDGF